MRFRKRLERESGERKASPTHHATCTLKQLKQPCFVSPHQTGIDRWHAFTPALGCQPPSRLYHHHIALELEVEVEVEVEVELALELELEPELEPELKPEPKLLLD